VDTVEDKLKSSKSIVEGVNRRDSRRFSTLRMSAAEIADHIKKTEILYHCIINYF
jgi:hypothetical protein